jgi:hypothetical protein
MVLDAESTPASMLDEDSGHPFTREPLGIQSPARMAAYDRCRADLTSF